MLYREVLKNGDELSVLGYGCMRLPTRMQSINQKLAEKAHPNAFSEKEVKLVRDAAAEFRKVMRVGCTGCQYCMPCPAGVDIPNCFSWYNSRHTFKDKTAKFIYIAQNGGVLRDKVTLASRCEQCEECLENAPNTFPYRICSMT